MNGVAKASSRERAADGSTGSSKLADLYERSGPGSIRLAYLLTGDPAVAEDIAQGFVSAAAGREIYGAAA